MKKIIMIFILLLLSANLCFISANEVVYNEKQVEIRNVERVSIHKVKDNRSRSLNLFPEVYLNVAEYRLYVIHPQNGDMGTFRIEDPSGMIEHSDSYKADGSTNEFSLPPFLSGPYTIILECGGEEYEGEFVI